MDVSGNVLNRAKQVRSILVSAPQVENDLPHIQPSRVVHRDPLHRLIGLLYQQQQTTRGW